MDLLLDTHMLVWAALDSNRMSARARHAIEQDEGSIFVSAVVAWEYTELNRRGRFESDLPLGPVLQALDARVLDLPADLWRIIETLPNHHRDPIDRMLVAHAIHTGLTLVTADETIRRYPLATLW